MNLLLKTLSFIFGLLPLNRRNKRSIAFIDYLIMVVMPVAFLACYFLVIIETKYGIYHQATCDSICRTGNKLFMHMGGFLYLTVASLCLWRRKNFYVRFDEHLLEIDALIEQCYRAVNDKEVQTNVKKRLYYITWVVMFLVFTYNVGYDAYMLYMTYDKTFFITMLTSSFPYVAGSLVQAQFIFYVSIIADRFQKINNVFEKISKECDKKNAPIEVFDIESDLKKQEKKKKTIKTASTFTASPNMESVEKNVNRKLKKEMVAAQSSCDEDDNVSDLEENYSSEAEVEVNEKRPNDGITSEVVLPDLFKLHDKILALSVLTNLEYGAQAVPYMATCFVISIFGIFLWTKVMFVVGGKNVLLTYVVTNYMIWSVTMVLVAYLVLRLCCTANSYSKLSVLIIHEIMQKKPAFMLGNDIYYNKMKSFTLQFLHWESFFQFNGIGLFALDYTFIFSTVSAATSYLIVLLQFDMSAILKSEGLV